MSSDKNSASTPMPSPGLKPSTSSDSEMLTPSEIESLRRETKEGLEYGLKVFAKKRLEREKQAAKA